MYIKQFLRDKEELREELLAHRIVYTTSTQEHLDARDVIIELSTLQGMTLLVSTAEEVEALNDSNPLISAEVFELGERIRGESPLGFLVDTTDTEWQRKAIVELIYQGIDFGTVIKERGA